MKYIVYKTTHLPTSKYYIGLHGTNNPEVFDGYYGSGAAGIKELIKHHPLKEFVREVLFIGNSFQEAYNKENELVTIETLNDKKCLNRSEGGKFTDKINPLDLLTEQERSEMAKKRVKDHPNSLPNNKGRKHEGIPLENIKMAAEKRIGGRFLTNGKEERWIYEKDVSNFLKNNKNYRLGRKDSMVTRAKNFKHTEKSKKLISEFNKNKIMITDGKINKWIKQGDIIPSGFKQGMIKVKKKSYKQYYCPNTNKTIRVEEGNLAPKNYICLTDLQDKKNQWILYYNTHTKEKKRFNRGEEEPNFTLMEDYRTQERNKRKNNG